MHSNSLKLPQTVTPAKRGRHDHLNAAALCEYVLCGEIIEEQVPW
jgi:hypothetical protein